MFPGTDEDKLVFEGENKHPQPHCCPLTEDNAN